MSFAGTAIAIGGAAASMAAGASAAGDARQAYKQAMEQIRATLAANDATTNVMLNPYRASGRKGLNLLDSAISPTATRDYSMLENPGKRPVSDWTKYVTLDNPIKTAVPAAKQTATVPGLAGMLKR